MSNQKIKFLRLYTQKESFHEKNNQEILDIFIEYSQPCSDPLNIFQYMQKKSICIFFASFWLAYSKVYSQVGDYKKVFICIKEAKARLEIMNEKQIELFFELLLLMSKIKTAMKKKKSKGTAFEYEMISEEDKIPDHWKHVQRLSQLDNNSCKEIQAKLTNLILFKSQKKNTSESKKKVQKRPSILKKKYQEIIYLN